ncbi:hypothetical protein BCR44DRAFT_1430626 [Catenaria anguillulae PL171]|uniref:Uncharacterized protein n=1 Tax=Catenaria anguillulae PL171 TaxID=765915 RepID=A0A1Y2HRG8_9FUNG|nr:hypothetical protein BCR44DRAFT_1430626 [Catenaria anguillulae PL171]
MVKYKDSKHWTAVASQTPVDSQTALSFKKKGKSASALYPPTQPALRSLLKRPRSVRRSRSAPTRHQHRDVKSCHRTHHEQRRPQTATDSKKAFPTGLGQVATKYADAWGIQLLPLVTKPLGEVAAVGAIEADQESEDEDDEQDVERKVKELIRKEAAYVAASHRPDRPLTKRIESAQRAADLHEQRTGRRLKVTAQFVEEGMVYPEM